MIKNCTVELETTREFGMQYAAMRSFYVKECGKEIPEIPEVPCIPTDCPIGYYTNDPVRGVTPGRILCSNDESYCNKFVPGDILYLQYQFEVFGVLTGNPMGWNTGGQWGFDIIIEDLDGNVLMSGIQNFADNYGVGWDCDYSEFREWININTSFFMNYDSFVIHLIVKDDTDTTYDYFSYQYCQVQCDEQTILITSEMTQEDVDGFWYQTPANYSGFAMDYFNQIRIAGNFMANAFDIETTFTNGTLTKTKKVPNYLMRTEKISPDIAEKFALICAGALLRFEMWQGQTQTTNEIYLKNPESVTKNFDEGMSWILEIVFKAKIDDFDINCLT